MTRASFVLLLAIALISMSACTPDEVGEVLPAEPLSPMVIVHQTDSDEWQVQIFKEHLLYSEAQAVVLPSPFRLPNKAEAQVLRQVSLPSDERFITSDGYTFGMPSASVSKAGQKTHYSVLGLYRRTTLIRVPF